MVQPKTLTLLGKADPEVVKQFTRFVSDAINNWFFVDYAEEEVPVEGSFDVLLRGSEKTLIPNIAQIILKEVFDQFGNKLPAIPKGFQTISSFQFSQIPKEIEELPTLHDWEYNPNAISLAKHEFIQLSQPDEFLTATYSVWIGTLKSELGADRSGFTKPEVVQFFREYYHIDNLAYITKVLNHWMMLGFAEEKPDSTLELIA